MRYIDIKIEKSSEGLPVLITDIQTLATQWDTGSSALRFTRHKDFRDFDMKVQVKPRLLMDWVTYNLGAGDELTITNAITRGENCLIMVAFYQGDAFRLSSDTVQLFIRSAPQSGGVPQDKKDEFAELQAQAFTSASYSEVTREYIFRNQTERIVSTLPIIGGGGPGTAATFKITETRTGAPGSQATTEETLQSTSASREYILTIPRGETGQAGTNGINGTNGTNGSDGQSALEVARAGGYTGTEAEFYAALANVPNAILSTTIRNNVVLTMSEYQSMLTLGEIDPNTAYDIIED